MADGSRVQGETRITASTGRIVDLEWCRPIPSRCRRRWRPSRRRPDHHRAGIAVHQPHPQHAGAGVPEAIARSRAVKVFVCNLMTQSNESLGLSAADHIRAIYKHAGHRIFDYALLNSTPVKPAQGEIRAGRGGADCGPRRDGAARGASGGRRLSRRNGSGAPCHHPRARPAARWPAQAAGAAAGTRNTPEPRER